MSGTAFDSKKILHERCLNCERWHKTSKMEISDMAYSRALALAPLTCRQLGHFPGNARDSRCRPDAPKSAVGTFIQSWGRHRHPWSHDDWS
jgi:hypothetical protein